MSRLRRQFVALAACAMVTVGSANAVAGADPLPPPPDGVGETVVVEKGMKRGGVDHAVAQSRGFAVATDENGVEYVVPTPQSTNPDGTPYVPSQNRAGDGNVLYNDCGLAFVYVHPLGGLHAVVETGFELYDDAVAYYWKVFRDDNYGSDSNSWAGGLAYRDEWKTDWEVVVGGLTPMRATVSTTSDAILWDGTICTAGPAMDVDYIF